MRTNRKSSLVKNSKGQGVMEYVIISSLIGIACLVAMQNFGKTIDKKIKAMNEKIDHRISYKLFK